jgi:hypothetical protein
MPSASEDEALAHAHALDSGTLSEELIDYADLIAHGYAGPAELVTLAALALVMARRLEHASTLPID